MRIALASWETLHSVSVGGVAVHVSELAAALQRRGHEVHVFTRQSDDRPWDECIDGVWYHRCGFDLDSDFIREIDNMCGAFVDRFAEVQDFSGGFDIFHAHDWLTSNSVVWAQEGFDIKTVLSMHSTEYGRCGNNFNDGGSERIMERERSGIHAADRVIAVSHTLKGELCWIYEAPDWKVNVVYNGVSPHLYEGFVDPGEIKMRYDMGPMDPMILYVGRMAYQKGPDLLLYTAPSVLKFYDNAKFVFVGDGGMREHLEHEADRIGVSHACRFLGYKQHPELADLYKASNLVSVPSRNEPFGIVILEAWSAGKPVVSTENGGPSEFVWHGVTGLRTQATVDSVAWGVGEMLSDMDRARWMGHNGRIAVETAFSWGAVAERTEQVYTS